MQVGGDGKKNFAAAWSRGDTAWWVAAGLLLLTLYAGLEPPAAAGTQDGRSGDTGTVLPAVDAAAPGHGATPRPPLGTLPIGKGMWLNVFERAHGGDAHAVVATAKAHHLTHLYVRLGSSKKGFYARPVLDRLLPVAHAAGLKVVGWDFPYFHDPAADADRAREQIWYTTPDGHRIDAFSADIETPAEGTHLSAGAARLYGSLVRQHAGPRFPLIATVPRPNSFPYPYADVVADFDAVAPMVYWGPRDPAADVAGALATLASLGKPLLPVGQAYDPAIDGGRGRVPTADDLERFMAAAAGGGAVGASFWVWETATAEQWSAIKTSGHLTLSAAAIDRREPAAVSLLQRALAAAGQPTVADGVLGPSTAEAVAGFQRQAGLPATGTADGRTVAALLRPAGR